MTREQIAFLVLSSIAALFIINAVIGALRDRRRLKPTLGRDLNTPLANDDEYSLAAVLVDEYQRRTRAKDRLPSFERPRVGDRRYSTYFGSYLELVWYNGDNDYRFKPLTGPSAGRTLRNQSPWSLLPLHKPIQARETRV